MSSAPIWLLSVPIVLQFVYLFGAMAWTALQPVAIGRTKRLVLTAIFLLITSLSLGIAVNLIAAQFLSTSAIGAIIANSFLTMLLTIMAYTLLIRAAFVDRDLSVSGVAVDRAVEGRSVDVSQNPYASPGH